MPNTNLKMSVAEMEKQSEAIDKILPKILKLLDGLSGSTTVAILMSGMTTIVCDTAANKDLELARELMSDMRTQFLNNLAANGWK